MGAFSNLDVDWTKAGQRTAEAMGKHTKDGKHESKRGWVTIAADVAGIVAGVVTEAFVFEIPVVDIVLPPLVGYATKQLVEHYGNKMLDHFEKKAAEEPARPAKVAAGRSWGSTPALVAA